MKAELNRAGIQATVAVDSEVHTEEDGVVSLYAPGVASPARLHETFELQGVVPLKVIYLCGLDEGPAMLTALPDVGAQVSASNMKLLNIVKGLGSAKLTANPTLWLVTAGAVDNPGVIDTGWISNPRHASLWGLGRVIRNEYPDMDCRMIDLHTNGSIKHTAKLLTQEIIAGDGEEEILYTDNARKVVRLEEFVPGPDQGAGAVQDTDANQGRYQLICKRAGSIDNLEWHGASRQPLAADQVEIEVFATGLNFRDVMYVSGLLPDEMLEGGMAGATLGLECAGRITGIGPGVENFSVGDPVIAMAPSCFSSHVIASKHTVSLEL
jgi:hypothetical protein